LINRVLPSNSKKWQPNDIKMQKMHTGGIRNPGNFKNEKNKFPE
jgi:hypothetical protein